MKRIFLLCFCAVTVLTSCTKVSEAPVAESTVKYIAAEGGTEVFPIYGELSDEERALYDKIRDAVMNFEEFVTFEPAVPKSTVRDIYRLVYSQERKYFWLSSLFYSPDEEVSALRLNYLYEREEAELMRAELDMAASTIIGGIPEGADEFETVVYFHDEIVRGCEFSTEKEHVNSAYGVLVSGYGQCEGYAAAMALLCDKAGIPNFVVCGTNSEGSTHAWNKIMLDGEWYNADCTWDDPIIKRDNPDFVRHDYLLVKDSEIEGISHFTDGLYDGYAVCDSGRLNYFAGRGLMFGTADEAVKSLKEQLRTKGLAGEREVEVRISDGDAYFAAVERLFDGGEMKQIIEDVNANYGTKIRSAYKHNNDDLCIIHISLIFEGDGE